MSSFWIFRYHKPFFQMNFWLPKTKQNFAKLCQLKHIHVVLDIHIFCATGWWSNFSIESANPQKFSFMSLALTGSLSFSLLFCHIFQRHCHIFVVVECGLISSDHYGVICWSSCNDHQGHLLIIILSYRAAVCWWSCSHLNMMIIILQAHIKIIIFS